MSEKQENKVMEGIYFILVAFLLAFGIYQTVGTFMGTDTPVVSVVSNSMKPTFERGDIVLVRGAGMDEIEEGDIIVYKSRHDSIKNSMPPMIHRVIEKNNDTVTTEGDANSGQVKYCLTPNNNYYMTRNDCKPSERLVNIEEDIQESQILGKKLLILPNIGHLKLVPSCLFKRIIYPKGHAETEYLCGDIL